MRSSGEATPDDDEVPAIVWLLPWEKILCSLPLADVARASSACKHFSHVTKSLRFWQLYFLELVAASGAKYKQDPVKLRVPTDMPKSRIAEMWKRLVQAESLKLRGNALVQEGKPQEAYEAYTQALAVSVLRPDKLTRQMGAVIYNNRATVSLALDRASQACFDAHHATMLCKKWDKAHRNLGKALANCWFHKDAAAAFATSNQLSPDNSIVHLLQRCDRIVKSNDPPAEFLFLRKPLSVVASDSDAASDASSAPSIASSIASELNGGRLFLAAPDSYEAHSGAILAESSSVMNNYQYVFEGEASAVDCWALFEALQMRAVEGPRGFVCEPLDLVHELEAWNQRKFFVDELDYLKFNTLPHISRKKVTKLAEAIRAVLAGCGNDLAQEEARHSIIQLFGKLVGSLAMSTYSSFDSANWNQKQKVPISKSDTDPLKLEICSDPYPLAEPPPKNRLLTTYSNISLNVSGPIHFSWCSIDASDSEKEPEDSDSELEEETSTGKLLIEIDQDGDMTKAFGRLLAKSLMTLRDDSGTTFPRHLIVTNGMEWWFVKLGCRLHVYGTSLKLDQADFTGLPQAGTSFGDHFRTTPTFKTLRLMLQWMTLFLGKTISDNLIEDPKQQKQMRNGWTGI
ncbi:MAG: F-box protein [archaeon]|nr:F-box protein [archaeon]